MTGQLWTVSSAMALRLAGAGRARAEVRRVAAVRILIEGIIMSSVLTPRLGMNLFV